MPSLASSGTQTCTPGTNHTVPGTVITAPTGGGLYRLRVRTNNLQAAETLTVRLRVRPISGGVTEDEYPAAVFGAGEPDPLKGSPVIDLPVGGEVSAILLLEGGVVNRDVGWFWMKLDG
jgi:hypothetical protein